MRAQQQRAYRVKVMDDIRGRKGDVWPKRAANGGGGSFPPRPDAGTEAPEVSLDFKSGGKGGKSDDA